MGISLTSALSVLISEPMSLKTMVAERGLKQNWVASRLGVSQSHFSEMIRGLKSVPVEVVLPLAEILNTSAEDVLRAIAGNDVSRPARGKAP